LTGSWIGHELSIDDQFEFTRATMIVALVGDKPGMMVVGRDCRIAVVDFAGAPLYVGHEGYSRGGVEV
jgi:hypothetical protein